MNKQERERKIKFIEILLTVGGLLGTALTLSKTGQIWELSLVFLPLFLLLSIIYYNFIAYDSLKAPKNIQWFKTVSCFVAVFFSGIFSNVIAMPIVDGLISIQKDIPLPIEIKIIALVLAAIIIVLIYFCIISKFIYGILTRGVVSKTKIYKNRSGKRKRFKFKPAR